ncbi:MAG: glycosyltransferase family 2 protein [Solirubrobacteraceae bacterium]
MSSEARKAHQTAGDGDDRAVRVTVAIPTYDGRELLEIALPSLAAQSYRAIDLLIVDDCSNDDTVRWLRSAWPDARVVALDPKVGVTAALNVCVREARSELLMLLNNDVELEPDCIEKLVEALDAHPEACAAVPKLLDFHDRGVIDGAGDIYTWTGLPGRRGHGERDVGQYDEPEEVFGACAGAALYRREAFERIGGFDESFFAYYEDADWSWRAQLAGLRCRYVPSAVVYHMGSATLGRKPSEFTRRQLWRNGLWLIAKDLPATQLLRHAPELLVGQAWHLWVALRTRRLRPWLSAWREAIAGLPEVLRKRRGIQAQRTATSAELERRIPAGRRGRWR